MFNTMTEASSIFTKVELRSAYGSVYRDVSTAAPQDCRSDETSLVDISRIYGDLEARAQLAKKIYLPA